MDRNTTRHRVSSRQRIRDLYSSRADLRKQRPDLHRPQERVWFGPIEGGLSWMRGGQVGSVSSDRLNQDVVYSIAGSANEVWIGRQQGGLTSLRYVAGTIVARTYTERDGLAQNSVYTVHQSADGTVWAGTLSGGVSRLKDGKFTTYTVANGLGANSIASIADAPDGTMWFATPGGLSELDKGSMANLYNQRWLACERCQLHPARFLRCFMDRHNGRPRVSQSKSCLCRRRTRGFITRNNPRHGRGSWRLLMGRYLESCIKGQPGCASARQSAR